jgi:DNA-binding winged helix-turn-helix (wHTH) protein/TolB-like protein
MRYSFGTFTFDARTLALARSDRPVSLEPQPARALALLLARAGEIVTRDELRAHLWGEDTHVDFDRGLAYCIGELRAALGDSADSPRFVQTLPKRGFKFIAPVTAAKPEQPQPSLVPAGSRGPALPAAEPEGSGPERGGTDARPVDRSDVDRVVSNPAVSDPAHDSVARPVPPWIAFAAIAGVALMVGAAGALMVRRDRPAAPPRRPIVAVALFENETGDASRDRLTASISDVIVERLTALGPTRLGVDGNAAILRRPRDARDWRAVARDTGAAYLVSGQLQAPSRRLSLLMQLIRLDDGTHVWVRRINRPMDDRLDGIDTDAAAQVEAAVRAAVLK